MKKLPSLPVIPEQDQTPLVKSLLALVEQFATHIKCNGQAVLDKTLCKVLNQRFDEVFTQKTSYATLNRALKRIQGKKTALLVVLKRSEIPLHTNGSETDTRDYVKKRKVSRRTRSDEGRRCRDTYASLKKTATNRTSHFGIT